jgi:TolB-like protein
MENFIKRIMMLSFVLLTAFCLNAQKPTLCVLNMDAQGINYTPQQLGNILRMEVEKLDKFEVTDRYDVAYLVEKHNLSIENCYGKICLTETGKTLNSDKMLSGSVDLFGDKIILSLRLVDVKQEKIEKAQVKEFLRYPEQIQMMIRIALYEMLEISADELQNHIKSLTNEEQYENVVINPDKNKLNLSGPRLGLTYFNGTTADIMTKPKYEGGYDVLPAMFMFGYQLEVQYLNSGNFQALFEFIPTITGVDQGLLMPNLSILMGFRHNIRGWEIALGPTAGLTKKANGYYTFDAEGNKTWNLSSDWTSEIPNPYPTEKRIDSRGYMTYHTGFVFAFGKSFKSGRMNYPVNFFVIPSKDSMRFGLTFGFNAKNRKI